MKNIIVALLISTTVSISIDYRTISPAAAVCLVGGQLKSQNQNIVQKYKRKNCPICKGKGWYISGDKIEKIDCGYCEPEIKEGSIKDSSKTTIFKE
jgi:hypothetical protein